MSRDIQPPAEPGVQVVAALDGVVDLRMTAENAQALAKVLVHYDILAADSTTGTVAEYVPEVWHFALIQLFRAAVLAGRDVGTDLTVAVPMRRFQVVRK